MNGATVSVPYCTANYSVYNSGMFIRYQTTFGLAVEIGGSTVNVYAPPIYRGLLRGICGNFDGDPSNDLISKDGLDYSRETGAFGYTWVVENGT